MESNCNADLLEAWLMRAGSAGAEPASPADAETVERALIAHGASSDLIGSFHRGAPADEKPVRMLTDFLRESFGFASVSLQSARRIMLVGAPAAGKSSMTAKLAAREAKAPTIFSTDTTRPGGMMRLAEYLRVLGIEPVALSLTPDTVTEIDAAQEPFIIDTAGIDAGDTAALSLLGDLAQAVSAEVVMVASALADPAEISELAGAAKSLKAEKVMISRLDMARRLGTVLALGEAGLTLCESSVTANFAYGLKPLTPRSLAERLLAQLD